MDERQRTKVGEFPSRKLVARVTRSERVGAPPFGRTSFEFDAIDAEVSEDDVERIIMGDSGAEYFAALRVVTTEACFERLFDFVPYEGMWVELSIRPRGLRPGPIAFHAQLQLDGYSAHSRGVLDEARLLFGGEEPPVSPKALGAGVPSVVQLANALVTLCQFPANAVASKADIRPILQRFAQVETIQVRDVGQASFVSLLSSTGQCIAHFDAGWPISFNGHTGPSSPPIINDNAPVILSHWDWDHLHAYYHCSNLRAARWVTPIQTLGPGARKIAHQLQRAGLLNGYSGGTIKFPGGALVPCTGTHPLNDRGLALILKLKSGKRALLVGDATYTALGEAWHGASYDFLVVTHHGAEFLGLPPNPTSRGALGVISVGRRNVYQHPRAPALLRHRKAGWLLSRTSSHGSQSRGDRFLGP